MESSIDPPKDDSNPFPSLSPTSSGTEVTFDSPQVDSSWRWFVPSLWASQLAQEEPRTPLEQQPPACLAVCPCCLNQGPEWARVIQEPPNVTRAQPPDYYLGRKLYRPPWCHLNWEGPWGAQDLFLSYRPIIPAGKKISQSQELLAASVGNVEWLHNSLRKKRKSIALDQRVPAAGRGREKPLPGPLQPGGDPRRQGPRGLYRALERSLGQRLGYTALHLATERGNLDCMRVLVEMYKFPVDMTTVWGLTPLHLALNKDNPTGSLKCMQYLVKQGASVNVNRNGLTPLHLAAQMGMLECIKVLVNAGANVHALDNLNLKSIDLSKIWNHRKCARFLKDAMWKQDKKDLAKEMNQLNNLKKQLLVMQTNYLLEKKKEREAQDQEAFAKWLQSKSLRRLTKIKIPKPSGPKEVSVLRKALLRHRLQPPKRPPQPRPLLSNGASPVCFRLRSWEPAPRPGFPRAAPAAVRKESTPKSPSLSSPQTAPSPSAAPSSPSLSSVIHWSRYRSSDSSYWRDSGPGTIRRRSSSAGRPSGRLSSRGRPVRPPGELSEVPEALGEAAAPRGPGLPQKPAALLHRFLAQFPPRAPPRRWNPSPRLASRPATQPAGPQTVRLGVHPDPGPELDFQGFLHFSPDGEGGACIQTASGRWLFPVPRLPFRVLLQELCPRRFPPRLQVPEGLRRRDLRDLPRRRYPGDRRFWTDSMAMRLRDTFDAAFIDALRAHQGLPPAPRSPPAAPRSSTSSAGPGPLPDAPCPLQGPSP